MCLRLLSHSPNTGEGAQIQRTRLNLAHMGHIYVLCSQAKMSSCQWRGPSEELEVMDGLDVLGFQYTVMCSGVKEGQVADRGAQETLTVLATVMGCGILARFGGGGVRNVS